MNSLSGPTSFDWSLMRSFLAVIERGSLLAAARQLRVSQPTLGRHVAELERQLGRVLFERTGLGVTVVNSAVTELVNNFGTPDGQKAQQIMSDEIISKFGK